MQALFDTVLGAAGVVPEPLVQDVPLSARLKKKKKGGKKHAELNARAAPLRGDAAKQAIDEKAEHNSGRALPVALARELSAKVHNDRAKAKVERSKESARQASEDARVFVHDSMKMHEQRRHDQVAKIRAKGAAESDKVSSAITEMQEATERKARAQDDAMKAHEERHVAAVGKRAAKGAAEARKVERVVKAQSTEAQSPFGRPISPDSVLTNVASKRRVRSPPDRVVPSAASVGLEAGMVLTLLRGGAPNAEVLLASTPEQFIAIARKHNITLPGGSSSSGGGGGSSPGLHSSALEPLPAPVFV